MALTVGVEAISLIGVFMMVVFRVGWLGCLISEKSQGPLFARFQGRPPRRVFLANLRRQKWPYDLGNWALRVLARA